jgi:hypothetical protein
MFYFAYGSNLSTLRLCTRVYSAQLVGKGQLLGHQLLFHKIGRDGSAKCNAYYTGREKDILPGTIYKIDPKHKINLDRAEGLGKGYEIKDVRILMTDGRLIEAFTYFATRIASDIKPFNWYREHVLAGAREHSFPDHYINKIASVRVEEDSDAQRTEMELSIYKRKP